MSKKRKAFTLTELLVVVVIIGVLSAVVLPKFTKVIETRKTTEAEEMMTAVRNEQEARCSISKNYTNDKNKLRSYKDGKNFNYTFEDVGMTASAKSGKYTLKMPSYVDGRICCSEGCDALNKDYPDCNNIPNFIPGNESCGANWEDTPVPPEEPGNPSCIDGTSTSKSCTNSCGKQGTKICTCTSGSWSCGGCSNDNCGGGGEEPGGEEPGGEDGEEPGEEDPGNRTCDNAPSRTVETESCGGSCVNEGTRTRKWDWDLCKWGEWGKCTRKDCAGFWNDRCMCVKCGDNTRLVDENNDGIYDACRATIDEAYCRDHGGKVLAKFEADVHSDVVYPWADCQDCNTNPELVGPSTTGTYAGCQKDNTECPLSQDDCGNQQMILMAYGETSRLKKDCYCAPCSALGSPNSVPVKDWSGRWKCQAVECNLTEADCAKNGLVLFKGLYNSECACVPCSTFWPGEGHSSDGTRFGCSNCPD